MCRSLFIFVACMLAVLPLRFAFAEDAATSTPPETPASTRVVSLTIRDGATLVWSGGVSVPDSDTATTTLVATDGTRAEVLAASALGALIAADATSSEFSISNLQYFSSFGSFYVKCIAYTVLRCDNWQYAVGTTYPAVGMDKFLMRDGDTLFVYFGSPRRITLSTSTVAVRKPFTATAEMYVPSSDSYIPAAGVTIGITQTNPNDLYTPLVIATSTTGVDGTATFSLSQEGAYAVGIAEDYYYPSVSLTVISAPAEAPASGEAVGGPSRNGSRRGNTPALQNADIAAALSFLAAHQHADGSFATPLLSDWAALAFAATPHEEPGEALLRRHLIGAPFSPSSATDYERHAMALMSLHVNPYSGAPTDYIADILSYFDGAQFGDTSLVNDDIFALIPLLRAGLDAADDPIKNTITFVLSRQGGDGSWEGNVDLTAAAMQALIPMSAEHGVSLALTRAREYLHAKQEVGGGFGNSFSTSWALQAIAASGDDLPEWQLVLGNGPREYLASLQFSDGGWEAPSSDAYTRVWATAYAIPAMLGKSWPSLLAKFDKPAVTSLASSARAFASVSVSVEGSAATLATSAPITLLMSTTTQSGMVMSASTSPGAVSTTEPVTPLSLALEAPTTSPQGSASNSAASLRDTLQIGEAKLMAAATQARNAQQTPLPREAPASLGGVAPAERNAASAVVAVEAAGASGFLLRFIGWVKRSLRASSVSLLNYFSAK